MKKKLIKSVSLILAIVMFLALCLSACSDDPDEGVSGEPVSDDTPQAHSLRLPYSKTDKLNPFTAESMINQLLCTLIYEGLFKLDAGYNPTANIASGYSQSGRTLSVQLGSAKFSDGSAVTASDVVASFNAAKSSPMYSAQLASFSSATVSGSNVNFALSADNPYAVNCLTFAIVKGGSTADAAVGTGRYTAQSGDGTYTLQKNAQSDINPKITEIDLYDAKDNSTLKYTLAIGNISFAFDDLRAGGYSRFSASTAEVLLNNMIYLCFNRSNSALNDEVKRAINLLIDREQIASNAFQGHAETAYTPFNPAWGALSGKDYTSETDREEAKRLLEAAGIDSSRSFRLLVNKSNSFKVEAADYIKDMLSAEGITVNVEALEEANFLAAVQAGNFDMYIGEIKLGTDMNLSPMLLANGTVSYGINTSSAASVAYAQLLRGETDLNSFIDSFNSTLPFIPLCYRKGVAAYTRSLKYSGGAHINDIFADIESWEFIS